MNKKQILGIGLIIVGSGTLGWTFRDMYSELKVRKAWSELKKTSETLLNTLKEKWPDAYEESVKRREELKEVIEG